VSAPNSAKPTTNPIALVIRNTGFANSSGASTGSSARRSTTTNATSAATARVPSPTMNGETQS
jgi:hypothetical protein